MRQISAIELREIASDIEAELDKLSQLEGQIQQVEMQLTTHPNLANIFYESLALKLHNFYTGCERIFQIVASELNGGLPSNYDWHRRLLTRMATQQEQRPALLSSETMKILQEYLAFRHVVRNIYGFELDPERLDSLVKRYPLVWRKFEQDVREFVDWLKSLADKLEVS
jgi:hypothetical protein